MRLANVESGYLQKSILDLHTIVEKLEVLPGNNAIDINLKTMNIETGNGFTNEVKIVGAG
jgi:hypothetical protein